MTRCRIILVAVLFCQLLLIATVSYIATTDGLDEGLGTADREVGSVVWTVPFLQARYGNVANLTSSETRTLYRSLLVTLQREVEEKRGHMKISTLAVACSISRWSIRIYSRERARSGTLSNVLLAVRDVFVHGLRYVPVALWSDIKASLSGAQISSEGVQDDPLLQGEEGIQGKTMISLRSAWNCWRQEPSHVCPSVPLQRLLQEKSWMSMLSSCTKANVYYNELARNVPIDL